MKQKIQIQVNLKKNKCCVNTYGRSRHKYKKAAWIRMWIMRIYES